MIRQALFIVLLVTANGAAHAQRWLMGAGIAYCSYIDKPGINVNLTYRVLPNLHVGPDFSALLTNERKENGRTVKRKEIEYNLNAQYLFELKESFALYPLVGANLSKVTNHTQSELPEKRVVTGLNTGGGIEWALSRARFFLEAKYTNTLSKTDVTIGVVIGLSRKEEE